MAPAMAAVRRLIWKDDGEIADGRALGTWLKQRRWRWHWWRLEGNKYVDDGQATDWSNAAEEGY